MLNWLHDKPSPHFSSSFVASQSRSLWMQGMGAKNPQAYSLQYAEGSFASITQQTQRDTPMQQKIDGKCGLNIQLIPHFFSPTESDLYLSDLLRTIPWEQKKIIIFGKPVLEPRLTAWIGDPGAAYAYSGIRLVPLPWTETLLEIKNRVESSVGEKFNSVLANLYRDHLDSMGLHSDDEKELGKNPLIASVSFGAARKFIMKHKTLKTLPQKNHLLESGSLLIMRGNTQHFWKHGIPKDSRPCGPRINLTFRRILD